MSREQRIAQFHQQLARRILILDGAMGSLIQTYKLDEAGYRGERFSDWVCDVKGNNDMLVLTQPQVIKDIHLAYLKAGADYRLNRDWKLSALYSHIDNNSSRESIVGKESQTYSHSLIDLSINWYF